MTEKHHHLTHRPPRRTVDGRASSSMAAALLGSGRGPRPRGPARLLCEVGHGEPERTLLPLPTGRLRVQSTFGDGTLRVDEYEIRTGDDKSKPAEQRLGRLFRTSVAPHSLSALQPRASDCVVVLAALHCVSASVGRSVFFVAFIRRRLILGRPDRCRRLSVPFPPARFA